MYKHGNCVYAALLHVSQVSIKYISYIISHTLYFSVIKLLSYSSKSKLLFIPASPSFTGILLQQLRCSLQQKWKNSQENWNMLLRYTLYFEAIKLISLYYDINTFHKFSIYWIFCFCLGCTYLSTSRSAATWFSLRCLYWTSTRISNQWKHSPTGNNIWTVILSFFFTNVTYNCLPEYHTNNRNDWFSDTRIRCCNWPPTHACSSLLSTR